MARWNSLGVYTPMFRNHAEINAPMREPWRFGPEIEQIMKKDIEQRYRLLPYIYSTFYQATQTGMPVSRSMAISYTTDEAVYQEKYQNQFLFGDNILVAPVESNKTTVEVYLPEGKWYRLSTDEAFGGKQSIQAAAPLTDLPVFIKAGAIIPMQNVIQSTSEKGDGILTVNGACGSYTYQSCTTSKENPILLGTIQPNQLVYVCALNATFTPDDFVTATEISDKGCSTIGSIALGPKKIAPVQGMPPMEGISKIEIGIEQAPTVLPCSAPDSWCYTVVATGVVSFTYYDTDGYSQNMSVNNETVYVCAWEDSIKNK
jgi:hypothetical protein